MGKDLGIIMHSAPSHKSTSGSGLAEGPVVHVDQKLPPKKAGMHVQTRRDTTEPIEGEPDYIAPEAWPAHHIAELNKAKEAK